MADRLPSNPPTAQADPAHLFSAAKTLFDEGKHEDAWEMAEAARAGFSTVDPLAETDVLFLLARIAQARGFSRVGEERIARAIADRTDLAEGTVPLAWYELHASLASANGEHATATGAWEAAVKVARAVRGPHGEGVERLCLTLRALGDDRLTHGDKARAREVFAELVRESKELAASTTEPHAFRHVTSSLHRLGDTCVAAGDLAAAISAYRDAVREAKKAMTADGETPETLWELSVGLNRLGKAQLDADQGQAAVASFEAAVDARRTLLAQVGRSAQALSGLASSLSKLSVALHHVGDVDGSNAAADEASDLDAEAARSVRPNHMQLTMVPPPVAR